MALTKIKTDGLGDSAVTSAKISDGSIVNADVNDVAASKLTGALPAISGASLTNLPGGGKVLQVVNTIITATQTMTADGVEEGITGLTVSITPSATTSKVLVSGYVSYGADGTTFKLILKRGSNYLGRGNLANNRQSGIVPMAYDQDGNQSGVVSFEFLDAPATTSSVTYSLYVLSDNNQNMHINRSQNDYDTDTGGRYSSSVTAMEIGA